MVLWSPTALYAAGLTNSLKVGLAGVTDYYWKPRLGKLRQTGMIAVWFKTFFSFFFETKTDAAAIYIKHKSWTKVSPFEQSHLQWMRTKIMLFLSTCNQIHRGWAQGEGQDRWSIKQWREKKKKKNHSCPFTTNLLTNWTTMRSAPKSNPLDVQTYIPILSKMSEWDTTEVKTNKKNHTRLVSFSGNRQRGRNEELSL